MVVRPGADIVAVVEWAEVLATALVLRLVVVVLDARAANSVLPGQYWDVIFMTSWMMLATRLVHIEHHGSGVVVSGAARVS